MTKRITVAGHKDGALVDDGDYERVSRISWRAAMIGRKVYAVSGHGTKTIRMQDFIVAPHLEWAEHFDGDTFNNTRFNLHKRGI